MIKQIRASIVMCALLACGCSKPDPVSPSAMSRPRFNQAPASGNGGKIAIPIDVEFPDYPTCPSGATLSLHVVGWFQVSVFGGQGNRNVELHTGNIVFTYSNAAGQTFVWREVGSDHLSLAPNGDLIVASVGRDGFQSIIGRIVVDDATGEVRFEAGKPIPFRDDQACAALT